MPNFRKQFNRFVDFVLDRPEYYRFMRANQTGYRSRMQAMDEFQLLFRHESATRYILLEGRDIEYALRMYGRAGRPKLGFIVLGNSSDRLYGNMESTEAYPFVDNSMLDNLGQLSTSRRPIGSVLASSHWTFYMNDLLIYGGVANRVDFYLGSRRIIEALWDQEHLRPTIFGRELLGLFAAGYEVRRLMDGSEAMVPPEGEVDFSLVKYILALSKFSRRNFVSIMTRPELTGIDFSSRTGRVIPYNERIPEP